MDLAGLRERPDRRAQRVVRGEAAGVLDALLRLVEDVAPDVAEVPADVRDALLEADLGRHRGGEVRGQLALERGQPRVPEALQRADDRGVAGAAGRAELLRAGEEQGLGRRARQVPGDRALRGGQGLPLVAHGRTEPLHAL